jgi:hypothetical protein
VVIWFGLVFVSLCTGLVRPPWWTVLAWPAASVGLGVASVAAERPEYDVHGFGYLVGAVVAVLCVVAWCAGRGVAAVARHRRSNAKPRRSGA